MVDFLVAEKHLTRDDAYMLVSVAGDVDITELVDRNKGVHVMMPKAIFIGGPLVQLFQLGQLDMGAQLDLVQHVLQLGIGEDVMAAGHRHGQLVQGGAGNAAGQKPVTHAVQHIQQLLTMSQALGAASVESSMPCSIRMESSAAIGPGPATMGAWLSAGAADRKAAAANGGALRLTARSRHGRCL